MACLSPQVRPAFMSSETFNKLHIQYHKVGVARFPNVAMLQARGSARQTHARPPTHEPPTPLVYFEGTASVATPHARPYADRSAVHQTTTVWTPASGRCIASQSFATVYLVRAVQSVLQDVSTGLAALNHSRSNILTRAAQQSCMQLRCLSQARDSFLLQIPHHRGYTSKLRCTARRVTMAG